MMSVRCPLVRPLLCPYVSVRVRTCPYGVRMVSVRVHTVSVRCPGYVGSALRAVVTSGISIEDQHWYEQLETNEEAATEEILRVANTWWLQPGTGALCSKVLLSD